jgi:hypothetical protein
LQEWYLADRWSSSYGVSLSFVVVVEFLKEPNEKEKKREKRKKRERERQRKRGSDY